MARATVNGQIELEYDTIGSPDDPTLLLIMGLTAQLIAWPDKFCSLLADRSYHVVRFDNRDCGLSTKFDGVHVDIAALMAAGMSGQSLPEVPYTLTDMAADAVGLLDHLGIDRAHLFGVSMGGMIVQTIAIEHPDRVASLTSGMSTTGDPDVGTPTPEAMSVLMSPPSRTRAAYQDAAVHHAGVWGSPGLFDEPLLRRTAGESWDRGYDPMGTVRQLAAILASGSRSAALAKLDVPTLVIHGTADTLVQISGGERTAEVIPDAKLLVIEGMGHDLAPPLWPRLIEAVAAHATEHR